MDTYDAYIKDYFNLHVVVLWTINDYLMLGVLCGCPCRGYKLMHYVGKKHIASD